MIGLAKKERSLLNAPWRAAPLDETIVGPFESGGCSRQRVSDAVNANDTSSHTRVTCAFNAIFLGYVGVRSGMSNPRPLMSVLFL